MPKNINKIFFKITDLVINFFLILVTFYESISKKFITFHKRPIYSNDVRTMSLTGYEYSNCAIVIQGPLLKKRQFTLETVRIYKKHYPNALIIVSTWDYEDIKYLKQIEQEVIVLQNKKPDYGGPFNLNFQIISANAGIKYALENKVKYILKTRTDQRMYDPYMLLSLINLSDLFPVNQTIKQKKRLIGISMGNMRDYYRLSDSFLFGEASDMMTYWSVHKIKREDLNDIDLICAESYLFREYLKKIGVNHNLTYEDSEKAYTNHCLFIDPIMIDWYWYKYKHHREFRYTSYKNKKQRNVSFLEWLNLFVHNKI